MDDAIPLYAVYALLFAASGLNEGEIALLFAIWTVVGIVAEVPSGAWADRFSRRSALITGGLLRAAGFALWLIWPEFLGFAAGFALWGLGGALHSGAFEALVYDGLDAASAADRYAGVMGRARSAGLIAEMLALAAATPLLLAGGYALVGWVSVAISLAGAAVAVRLPEVRGTGDPEDAELDDMSYTQVLRSGLAELLRRRVVLAAALAVMLVTGLDAIEEFSPLLAVQWGVPEAVAPIVLAGLSLSAAVATAFSGPASKLPVAGISAAVAVAALALGAAGLVAHPLSMIGFAVWHGLLRLAIVLLDARLQDAITGSSRATVTSVASLGTELAALPVLAAYAGGGLPFIAGLALFIAVLIAATLPRWLGARR